MVRNSLYILSFLALFLLAHSTYATHLVGGFINYQRIGESSSGVQYTITITSYRDCKPGSIPFPDDIEVCVYHRGTNRLTGSYVFPYITKEKVNPVGRTDCPEATSVCLERAIFQRTIVLPKNSFGYFVKWEICCRNTQVNLRNDQNGQPFIGQTYQTIIPDTYLDNSSPYFLDVPVPFICVNDTVEINNYAIDPDGDKLVYKLATPWYGASISNNYPGCASTYSAPQAIRNIDYAGGYSGAFPFGTNGHSEINANNGIARFMARQIGNYAVAIDLEEWRNGKLLSTTRLDLQILVINCTPNNKPTIASSSRSFTVVAGDRLCFNVTGNDRDNQNLLLSGQGDLLTGANGFKGTRATFANASGQRTVTSQFCWQTDCDQASTTPYIFTARVIDDGCPSKFTFVNFEILVTPFTGRSQISGPQNVCQGAKGVPYTINTTANTSGELVGHTLDVSVLNGTLVSQTLTELVIDWDDDVTSGKITVTPVSRYGCPGDTVEYTVNLQPSPPKPIILPSAIDTVCENTNRVYSVQAIGGMTYNWWVSNGSVLGSSTNNSVNITWSTPGNASAKVVQYNVFGCPSDTSTVLVWVSKPLTSDIVGRTTVCPNSSGIQYRSNDSEPGSTFYWEVVGGVITGSNSSNSITVNWGNPGIGYVKVIEINRFGCKGDTVRLDVEKTYDLIANTILGDTDICENTLNQVFMVPVTPNTTYAWTVNGGTITSGQGTSAITVDWGVAGTGSVSMYETSFDLVNNRSCVSNITSRIVNIRPYPTADTILGVREICQFSPNGTYTVNGMPGSSYVWSINGDTSDIQGQGTQTIQFTFDQEGVFNIRVEELSEFGCIGDPIFETVIVHPKPRTTPIIGDSVICSPNLLNYPYSTSGFSDSRFDWFISGGLPVAPSATSSISVNWTGQQNNTIKVLETSRFGCVGDTITLNVFYDNPSIYLRYITVNPPPLQDDGIDVHWSLVNAPRYNNQMFIERRRAGTSDLFVTVGTVSGSSVHFNHFNTNNDSNAWDYRVRGFDLCGRAIYTNVHTNVFLSGYKPGTYSVVMNFTPYLGWGTANIRYDVYRMLKNSGGYELYESNVTDFNIAYENGLEYYTQCYRISATKIGTDTVSWSNDICFNFEPTLFITDAFSPNVDEVNDKFSVKGGALKTFNFMIYNRWGEKLYETDDLNFAWDGTYKGQDQPQDVYMFYCYYTGFDGKKYSTKGTITLLR